MRSAARTSVPHPDPARALGVRRPRFEPHDVRLREPELGGLLDRDDPLGGGIAPESVFSRVVLPALVPPATRRFHPAVTAQPRNADAAVAEPERVERHGTARRSAGW